MYRRDLRYYLRVDHDGEPGILQENFRKRGITATGSASCDFESDLIVWRGSFTAYGETTQEAYQIIKRDAEVIKKYLQDNGVTEEEMIFGSVDISQRWEYEYNEEGYEIGYYLVGYDLEQQICVTSNDVDKVDPISRDSSQLIEAGVEFFFRFPGILLYKTGRTKASAH